MATDLSLPFRNLSTAGDRNGDTIIAQKPYGKLEKSTLFQATNVRTGDSTGASAQGGGVQPSQHKKRNKKRSGKQAKNMNLSQFVRETCTHLHETKYPLMWAAVRKLGVDFVRNLIKEVDVIERCGGQMTNDGKRRRTPGGVLWNILRGRVHSDMYKEIMSQGNKAEKQKVKDAKESLKRNRMDIDEPIHPKRQKLAVKDVDMCAEVAHGKQISQPHQQWRPAKNLLDVIDGPQRDDSLLPVIQLQNAWAEGIRKKVNFDEASALLANSPVVDSGVSNVEHAIAFVPEMKPVPVFERVRALVEYSDLVKEKKWEHSSEKLKAAVEYSDVVDRTHCENLRTQDPDQEENYFASML